MALSQIKSIKAKEILNSRGEPTVEAELKTNLGVFRASVPSGASTGKYEAKELRDNQKRYFGKGVLGACKNINEIIAPKLKGKNPVKQKNIDQLMLELDGTKDKSKLGANAILAVSTAVCRAGAMAESLPLYKHIRNIAEKNSKNQFSVTPKFKVPFSCFNIINGGAHAENDLDIQEFMIVPGFNSFSKNLEGVAEIYHTLKGILEKEVGNGATNVGDEGGFAPLLKKTKDALDLIIKAIKKAGYQNKIKIGLDCAASQFYKNRKYQIDGKTLTKEKLFDFYQEIIKEYPILFLEDPFAEQDWQAWELFKPKAKKQNKKVFLVGDDLTVTNQERIRKAISKDCIGGVIIKPNQIGTVIETIQAVNVAQDSNLKIIVSHRSGDTCDNFISDLAVGVGADFIKSGAPIRGERISKYNRLLKIERELNNR